MNRTKANEAASGQSTVAIVEMEATMANVFLWKRVLLHIWKCHIPASQTFNSPENGINWQKCSDCECWMQQCRFDRRIVIVCELVNHSNTPFNNSVPCYVLELDVLKYKIVYMYIKHKIWIYESSHEKDIAWGRIFLHWLIFRPCSSKVWKSYCASSTRRKTYSFRRSTVAKLISEKFKP